MRDLADGVLKVGAPLLAVSFTRSPALVALTGAAATLPWLLLAVVLLACVAEVPADTAAQSVLPTVVAGEDLTRANGRVVGAQVLGNDFAGAPLAGVLVTVLPAAVLGAPGILYGVAGVLLLGMRGRFQARREAPRPMAGEIAESLRYLWSHRFLRTLALSAGLINMGSAAYFGVLVLWVVGDGSRMGLAPSGYGLMLPVPWLLYVTAVAWGVAGSASNVLVISTRQRIIPGELLGRVNAAYRLLGMGGMPVGAALGGLAGEVAGLPAVFLGATAVQVVAVAWVGRLVFSISTPVTSGVTIPDITGSR